MSWDEIFDPSAWVDFLGGGEDIASGAADAASSAGDSGGWDVAGMFDPATSFITPESDFFSAGMGSDGGFFSDPSGGASLSGRFGADVSPLAGFSSGGPPGSIGPPTGPGTKDDTDWKKWGRLATMLGLPVAASGMQTLMQPSAPKMPALPPPPAPASQSIPPFTDQPGTRASPLITAPPAQSRQTTGIPRRTPYGGFSMY